MEAKHVFSLEMARLSGTQGAILNIQKELVRKWEQRLHFVMGKQVPKHVQHGSMQTLPSHVQVLEKLAALQVH